MACSLVRQTFLFFPEQDSKSKEDAQHQIKQTKLSGWGNNLNVEIKEVKLSTSNAERDLWDSLAEIYSVIVTLDGIEKAYIKDCISEAEYAVACTRFLKQYRTILSDEAVLREFRNLESFTKRWNVCLMICLISLPPYALSIFSPSLGGEKKNEERGG